MSAVNMVCGPHTLVTGLTNFGKSSVVKRWIRDFALKSGKYTQILVLDEKLSPEFNGHFITDDPEKFLDEVERLRNCLIIIDEGPETIGQYAPAMRKITTIYRELGHQVFLISQRATMVDKTMRSQCSNLFTFMQGKDDIRVLISDFPRLARVADQVPDLGQGEYIFVPNVGEPIRGKAW